MLILQEHGDGSATVWGEFFKEHDSKVIPYFLGYDHPDEFYVVCESGKVPLVKYADENGLRR